MDALIAILLAAGGLLAFLASVGMVRLPDTLIRMHAATKAGTLGAGLILVAVGFHFKDTAVTLRAAMVIVFILLTAPVAAHLIGRAAHRTGIRLWKGTWIDQLDDVRKGPQAPSEGDR